MKKLVVIHESVDVYNDILGRSNKAFHGEYLDYDFKYSPAAIPEYITFVKGQCVYTVLKKAVCEYDEYEAKMKVEKEKKEDEELLAAMNLIAARLKTYNKGKYTDMNFFRIYDDGSWSVRCENERLEVGQTILSQVIPRS